MSEHKTIIDLLIRLRGADFPHSAEISAIVDRAVDVLSSDIGGHGASRIELLDLYSFRRESLIAKNPADPRVIDLDFLLDQLRRSSDERCQIVVLKIDGIEYTYFLSLNPPTVLGCIKG